MARARLLPTLAVVAALSASCASSRPEEHTCARAPHDVLDVIEVRLARDDVQLRNGSLRVAAESGLTFVSAETHAEGDPEDILGDVLTWVSGNVDGGQYFAVDVNAKEQSSWPEAPFDVRRTGAIESRGCVAYWAGDVEEVRRTVEGDTNDFDLEGF